MQFHTSPSTHRRFPAALIALAIALSSMALLSACEDKGPAEKAGESIDQGIENLQDSFDNDGPAENMGESIDETVDDAEDAMQDSNS